MDIEAVKTLALNGGGGLAAGGIAGFAAKKALKIVAVLAGLQLAGLKWLEVQGVVSGYDWSQISVQNEAAASDQLMNAVATLSATGGGFGAGFLVGFKKA